MRKLRTCLALSLLLAGFAVGWRFPAATSPLGLSAPINMSLQDSLLVVSDAVNGVHVYDVGDPAAPAQRYVIPLPGNRGTAVKGDILYANDYESLKVIRLEVDTFTVVKTIQTRYPPYPPDGIMMDRVETGYGFGCLCAGTDYGTAPVASGGSVGSSYATFAVTGDELYFLDYFDLVTMDISTPDDPVEVSRTGIGWEVETIYPAEEYLFLGGRRGMYIYSRSSPPVKLARFEHFEACDPVVVSGDRAYVTLRGGNTCGADRDVLLVIGVDDPSSPRLLNETPVTTPYGLAVRAPYLYVSTGRNGFKLFDVGGAEEPSVLASWNGAATKDFIWSGYTLFAMGFDNIRIYNAVTPDDPVMVSTID